MVSSLTLVPSVGGGGGGHPIRRAREAAMGHWIGVEGNCDDRRPVVAPAYLGEYACGHEYGILASCRALDVIGAIHHAFGDACPTFEVSLKIGDVANYKDDLLVLTPDERDLWALEVEQLRSYLAKSPAMPWECQRRWETYWEYPWGWAGNEQLSRSEFLRQSGITVDDLLADVSRVCQASLTTGKPIECRL
jgi:hypothetical protein